LGGLFVDVVWHNWSNDIWLNFSNSVIKHESLDSDFNEVRGNHSSRWNSPVSPKIAIKSGDSVLVSNKLVELRWKFRLDSRNELLLDLFDDGLLEQTLEKIGNLGDKVSANMNIQLVSWNIDIAFRNSEGWQSDSIDFLSGHRDANSYIDFFHCYAHLSLGSDKEIFVKEVVRFE